MSHLDPIWEQFRTLLLERDVDHPLGCHRVRISDRVGTRRAPVLPSLYLRFGKSKSARERTA